VTSEIKFIKENDFEQTPVGRIPIDWRAERVQDLFIVETGTTPSTKRKEFWDDGTINWITPTDLSKLNGNIRIKNSERKITEKAMNETSLPLLPRGSIIVSTRAPVGYVAMLEDSAALNQGCKGLIPKDSKEISPEFYCYYLLSKKQVLQNLSGGSTFKELSKNGLEQFNIPYPPLEEQLGIVDVLRVVDLAVAKTGEVIAKTERLKKGLMQELLTKGIGHKEHQFKKTIDFPIPEEWEIKLLREIITIKGRIGWRGYTIDDLREQGPIVIGATDIVNNKLELTKATHISREKYEESPEIKVKKDDIIVVKTGNSIGKVAIVDTNIGEACVNPNVALLKDPKNVNPYFLYYYLLTAFAQKYLIASSLSSAQPAINQEKLGQMKITLPSSFEQGKIVEILTTVDRKIDLERSEKSRLKRIKQGLTDLLLTGKVRVKVD